jgi:hypothetical protein
MSLKVKRAKVKLQLSSENYSEYVAERFDEFVRIAVVGVNTRFSPVSTTACFSKNEKGEHKVRPY